LIVAVFWLPDAVHWHRDRENPFLEVGFWFRDRENPFSLTFFLLRFVVKNKVSPSSKENLISTV